LYAYLPNVQPHVHTDVEHIIGNAFIDHLAKSLVFVQTQSTLQIL